LDDFEHAFPLALHDASQVESLTHTQSIPNVNDPPLLNSSSTSFTPPSLPANLPGQYESVFVDPTLVASQLDTSTHHGSIFGDTYVSAPMQPNAGHTPHQAFGLTNSHEQPLDLPNPPGHNPLQGPRHTCGQCGKSYSRKGELTRHVATVHHRPRSFLCHLDRCPRGIYGKGFARKDKLVVHLVSKKHGLSKVDALYEANLYNA
jgi:Zinc finger, C2H2 type